MDMYVDIPQSSKRKWRKVTPPSGHTLKISDGFLVMRRQKELTFVVTNMEMFISGL